MCFISCTVVQLPDILKKWHAFKLGDFGKLEEAEGQNFIRGAEGSWQRPDVASTRPWAGFGGEGLWCVAAVAGPPRDPSPRASTEAALWNLLLSFVWFWVFGSPDVCFLERSVGLQFHCVWPGI